MHTNLPNTIRTALRSRSSVVWPSIWLGVALVAIKGIYFGPPPWQPWTELSSYLQQIAAASYADLQFTLSLALAGQVAMWATARRPRARRMALAVFIGICTASVAYGFVNVYTVDYFGRPLTLPIILLLRDIRNLYSSLLAQLTPRNMSGLVAIPILYLLLVLGSLRWLRGSATQIASLALVLWAMFGHHVKSLNPDDYNRGFDESAHVALLQSSLDLLPGRELVLPARDWQPEDVRDFEPFADRRPTMPPAAHAGSPPKVKNVIQIVLESTGAKYLGIYGSPYDTTPHLAAEAGHSLIFDNVYSQLGYSFCSLVALTYSVYPGLPLSYLPLGGPIAGPTLAELLQARGYRTAFISSTDLNWKGMYTVLEGRGFDDVTDAPKMKCPSMSSWGANDSCMVDGMISWLDRDPGRPFFLMGWTTQTHDPYPQSPELPTIDFSRSTHQPVDGRLNSYLNVLRSVDAQLGRLFDALRARGLADDTLVVITGDHGEAFGSPHNSYGHGYELYQENVRVPLILWNPRLFPEGAHSDVVGAHVDIHPTIADLLGIQPAGQWQGFSLFDASRPQRAYFVAGCEGCRDYELGVRDGPWKYLLNVTRGRERLFDLSHDPDEQLNVADKNRERNGRMRQRLAAWVGFETTYLQKLSHEPDAR